MSIYSIFSRPVTLLYFLLCISGGLFGQTTSKKIDSLLAALPAAKEDSNKVVLLCQLATNYFYTDPAKGIDYGKKALELATTAHYERGIMTASMALGRCYGIRGDREAALKYFQDALTIARKSKDELNIAKALISFGATYKSNKEYNKAISYYLQAQQAFQLAGVKNMQAVVSGIGTCYTERSRNDTALPYYLQAIAMEEADTRDPMVLGALYNNAGAAFVGSRRYDSALPYLLKAAAYIQSTGNLRSAGNNFNNMGKTYLELAKGNKAGSGQNLARALDNEMRALDISYRLGLPELRLTLLINLIEIYSAQGNYKDALANSRQLRSLQDSFYNIDHDRAFAKVEAEYKVRQTTDSLKYQNMLKDKELKQKRIERYLLTAIIIFLGIVAFMYISRQQLKHKQKEAIARQQLDDFTQRIQEKNQMLEVVTAEVERNREKLDRLDEQALPTDDALLTELQQSILLTDEQWEKFKDTFDKVHKGYFLRLKNRVPDISPAETRFIMLSKLHLTPKEKAAMLGVNAQSMRVSKHRLLKKLDIEDDAALDDFIHSV